MDVDPTELIPSLPPAAKAAPFPKLPGAAAGDDLLDDADLEDENATLMFKRPGPPRKPPPAKNPPAIPVRPPAKPAPPPMRAMGKPPALKPPEKAPPAPPAFPVPVHLSEHPMFEVTLGSEKPLHATPDAEEISLLGAPRAPNLGLLAPPQASDMAALDFKLPGGAASPALPALPLLDFSRDVSSLPRSSPPGGIAPRVIEFARTHSKMFAMVGGTALIATVSWGVFHAAASSAAPAAASPSQVTQGTRAPLAATTTPVVRAAAPTPVAAATAEPVAALPVEPPAERAVAPAPPPAHAEGPAPSPELAVRPSAVAAAARAEEPANERPAPVAAEPVAKTASDTPKPRPTVAVERPATTHAAAEPATELPAAKAAPEPPPAPRATTPSVTLGEGMDGTPDFDQSAAMQALRQAAESSQRCRTADTPSGGVRIAVTFARSGAVSATQVEGSAAGTPLADCIVGKFQSAHVPAFRGSVMTVRKTVMFN